MSDKDVQSGPIKIRIADDRLGLVIATAYALSQPQGMGFLHAKDGPMPQADIDALIQRSRAAIADNPEGSYRHTIHMDYVYGRAVKFSIERDADGYYVEDRERWFDHGAYEWSELRKVL